MWIKKKERQSHKNHTCLVRIFIATPISTPVVIKFFICRYLKGYQYGYSEACLCVL